MICPKRMAVIAAPARAARGKNREASNTVLRMELRVVYPAPCIVRWRSRVRNVTCIPPKITFAPVWTAPYSPHGETRRTHDRSGGWPFDGRLWLRFRAVGVAAGGGDPRARGETGGRIARHAFRARGPGARQHDAAAAGRAAA